jgi:hypothetical protein
MKVKISWHSLFKFAHIDWLKNINVQNGAGDWLIEVGLPGRCTG